MASRPGAKAIPLIDLLRALAAWSVVAWHLSPLVGYTLPVFKSAAQSVDLFMNLSGFLMYCHYVLRRDREPWERSSTWLMFYVRRWFRIVPLFALLVGLTVLYPPFRAQCHLLTLGDGLRYFLQRITFVFGFFPSQVANSVLPDWSLALEMQFYLVFPFLMLWVKRIGMGQFFFWTCLVAAVATQLITYYNSTAPGPWGHFPRASLLPWKIHIFALGMVAAAVYCEGPGVLRSFWYFPGFLCLAAASPFGYTRVMAVGYAVCYLLLLFRFKETAGMIEGADRILGRHPLFHWPAETSYSAYLLHPMLFYFLPPLGFLGALFGTSLGFLLVYALGLIVVNAIGYGCFLVIEKPGIEGGRRLIGWMWARFGKDQRAGASAKTRQI